MQLSLMNNEEFQDHGPLMITGTACFVRDNGRVFAPPSRMLDAVKSSYSAKCADNLAWTTSEDCGSGTGQDIRYTQFEYVR